MKDPCQHWLVLSGTAEIRVFQAYVKDVSDASIRWAEGQWKTPLSRGVYELIYQDILLPHQPARQCPRGRL